jgi:nitroreductase
MTFAELVTTARTCRRFKGSMHLPETVLSDLVGMARVCPSARNLQPLRYATISDPETCEKAYSWVVLGGNLKPEQRATDKQHPGGYIVILGPTDLGHLGLMDIGIAAQTINLAATAAGLGCCMIGAFNKPEFDKLLNVPKDMETKLVLALGAPDEERQLTSVGSDGEVKYFRDNNDVHWVPKRSLEELIIAKC